MSRSGRNRRRTPQGQSSGRSRNSAQGTGRGPRGGRERRPAGLGGDQVEGRHAVRELFLAGRRRVQEVRLIDDLDPADILDDIVELASEAGVPVRRLPRKRFVAEALTQSHQGVSARADVVPAADLDQLARPGAFLLMLDGVTDPGNLGSLLRTAECAGVTGVVLPRHRAVHLTPTVTKTAAGAVEYLDIALVGGLPTALSRLADLGVTTVGLEAGGDRSMFDLEVGSDEPVALVLGAEGSGLSRLVRERVQILASIPMRGRLNSLNVAMAGAVACFEVVRARGEGGG